MSRADRRIQERKRSRKYSMIKVELPPVDEFDCEPVTKPIPPETMAMLIATVRS